MNIEYRNFDKRDLFSVLELMNNHARGTEIENFHYDDVFWTQNLLNWINQARENKALFRLAFKEDSLVGFLIAVPTHWHYSTDLYLEFKELIVDEDLSLTNKVSIIKNFTEYAESEARKVGLSGLSAFSIRENSEAYSNFFCKRLGWTKASGCKKIFE